MVAVVQIKRTSTPFKPPTGLLPGELAVEMGSNPANLWVGVPTIIDPTGRKLLNGGGVIVSEDAPPLPGQGAVWFESDTGILWMWYVDADAGQWIQINGTGGGSTVTIGDTAPATANQGDLFWESDTGILWIWYNDGNSAQWVQAAGTAGGGGTPVDAYTKAESDAKFVELAGDVMTGLLTVPGLGVEGNPIQIRDNGTPTGSAFLAGASTAGQNYWGMHLGNNTAPKDFDLYAYDDAGVVKPTPAFHINRANNDTSFTATMYITSKVGAALVLNDTTGAGIGTFIAGQKNGLNRWGVHLGDDAPEGGLDTGSNFAISAYNDDGATPTVEASLKIQRNDHGISTTGWLNLGGLIGGAVMYPGSDNQVPGVAMYPSGGSFFSNGAGMTMCVNSNVAGWLIICRMAGNVAGYIAVDATGTTYNTSSDERLKEDLKSFEAGHIVDDTMVYDFKWKKTGERAYGVVAQQAVNVYPAAVNYNADLDFWGIDYSKYVPVLLQELKALRARVADLEGRVTATPQGRG